MKNSWLILATDREGWISYPIGRKIAFLALFVEPYMARYVCGVGGYLYLNVLLELYASQLVIAKVYHGLSSSTHTKSALIHSAEL